MSNDSHYNVVIQIQIEPGDDDMPITRMERAIHWVLVRHDVADTTSVSVVVTHDEDVRQYNRTYRGIDKPTDVLSFPADPLPFLTDEDEPALGDLILALPYIKQQASREGHDWHDEIILAVIHGTLHLLGYDHDTPDRQDLMWAVQAEALAATGVPIIVPLFEFDAGDDDALSDADSGSQSSSGGRE